MTRITVDDPRPDPKDYRLHLTRAEIDRVLHYTHWIPNLKGFTGPFLAEHHPGWSLNRLVDVFKRSRVLLKDRVAHPVVGRCHWKVVELFYNSWDDYAVVIDPRAQWDDRFLAFEADRDAGA